MKIKPATILLGYLVAVLAVFESAPSMFAQGSLTPPPGPPAPTMKSLDQIEARTPLAGGSAAITISQPGSYYLTGNLTVTTGNAITIATNGVTLDLNGFTISSTASSPTGNAILLNSGLRNIAIKNGFIQSGVTFSGGSYSGTGFDSGINYTGTAPEGASVSHVSVTGVLNHGMTLGSGNSTVAESCTVRTGGGYGIVAAVVRDCSAIQWGITAIFGNQVSNCRGVSTGGFDGISAITAENCYGESNSGSGFGVQTAMNCFGVSAGAGYGIYADKSATNCYGQTVSGYGVQSRVANNCSGIANSGAGVGIGATNAINCYAYNSNASGWALNVGIAAFCYFNTPSIYSHAYFCYTGPTVYP
jgi:hypothetical protein